MDSPDSDRSWISRLQLLGDDDLETSDTETSGLSPGGMMQCLNCSKYTREKKLSVARSKQFCSLHCMQEWQKDHPPKEKPKEPEPNRCNMSVGHGSKRVTRSTPQATILSVSTHSPNDVQQLPAVIRKLYIDMAPPGSTLPHQEDTKEDQYSWLSTPPANASTIVDSGSARSEKNGSPHNGTSNGEMKPPLKKRRTQLLKQVQKTELKNRRKRCGKCAACSREDCGTCTNCRDKKKFGGNNTLKKSCVHRVCKHLRHHKPENRLRHVLEQEMQSSGASESERDEAELTTPMEPGAAEQGVESDETIGYCPSESDSESVTSDSMLVRLPYPTSRRQPTDNSSSSAVEASSGLNIVTGTRSVYTAEGSKFQDRNSEKAVTQSRQIGDIFISLEKHVQEVRTQMEESFHQMESENARLAKQLHEKEQANKQQKWLKEVALPKTSMPEQLKVVAKEHQVKVQEKMREIEFLKETCESQKKQLQEQKEENTRLQRKVKQQKKQMKRLQDENTKLKETIDQLEEARRTDQRVIQEKEEQNEEIAKWMKTIPTSLHPRS